jgi:ribosomal protein L19E
MVSLKLQKRLAASVLRCGHYKVWLDPNETAHLKNCSTRNDPSSRLSLSRSVALQEKREEKSENDGKKIIFLLFFSLFFFFVFS